MLNLQGIFLLQGKVLSYARGPPVLHSGPAGKELLVWGSEGGAQRDQNGLESASRPLLLGHLDLLLGFPSLASLWSR